MKLFFQEKGKSEGFILEGHLSGKSENTFSFQDFSLTPRKTSLWNAFPQTLSLNIEKTSPLALTSSPLPRPKMISRDDSPTKKEWEALFSQTEHFIRERRFQKVVLARKTTLTLDRPLDTQDLYKTLASLKTTGFLIQNENATFLGFTPERLFLREKNTFLTEAVAGTRRLGSKNSLSNSPKDKKEFDFVRAHITEKITPFSETFSFTKENRLVQTTHVEHLYDVGRGRLLKGVSDSTLIKALHPTAAVGGLPQDEALSYLIENEPFDRGWYAAPFGWTTPETTSIHVAIRSALVQENIIHLFAGVGIVSGSLSLKEWEELDHKIAPYLEYFS